MFVFRCGPDACGLGEGVGREYVYVHLRIYVYIASVDIHRVVVVVIIIFVAEIKKHGVFTATRCRIENGRLFSFIRVA